VNLPLLVKLAKVRSSRTLADAVGVARDAGRKYIACASELAHAADPAEALNGHTAPKPL
jgi:PTS system mannose-specific IIA component